MNEHERVQEVLAAAALGGLDPADETALRAEVEAHVRGCLECRRSEFDLVADVIDRVPKLGPVAAYAKQSIRDKLIEHKQYIARYGEDMPEITGWRWGQTSSDRIARP